MSVHLFVDDREHTIIKELNNITNFTCSWWSKQRLSCGDFEICGREPIMIIERKTYADFARSIRDSRIYNHGKLCALRNDYPSIILAILLEGTRPLSEIEPIDGIPYKSIRTRINHLRVRDKFQIFETRDVVDTVAFLKALINDIAALEPSPVVRVSQWIDQMPAAPSYQAPAPVVSTAPVIQAPPPPPRAPAPDIQSCVSSRRTRIKTVYEKVITTFQALPGIGRTNAEKIIRSGISISMFVQGIIPEECAIKRLVTQLSNQYRQERTNHDDCMILLGIALTSEDMMNELMQFTHAETPSLCAVCALSLEQLETFRYRGRTQKKMCESLFSHLHYGEATN